jgi:two-component system, cell cycle response regulator DivK
MGDRAARDLKVLLVEDFEDTRLFMRLELEEQGFIVFEAENGKVAVEIAIREKPDVILMDLTLPLMDGFAATKLIRQNEELKNVPVIAVTAHKENDFRSDAKASGFDAYVTKPIDVNWLKDLIAGLLI